jgi:predicted flap endonuclease-1-like 5' DNA nuclease
LDDLIRIEGIGPKISTIVVAAGITSFSELAGTGVEQLKAILEEAGIHTANPSTWPEQAHLAAQAKWDELQELQDRIKNGRLEA